MFRQWIFFLTTAVTITSTIWAQSPRRVTMSQLSMPESLIYFLLRDRSARPALERANLERNLHLFRAYAHDRRRQVLQRWLTPLEFERRREAFHTLCREAQTHLRQATPKGNPTHREQLDQSRHRAAGQAKLRQAAGAWADPLLRTFLLGAAALREKDFKRAEGLFAQCIEDEPRIAAFHQGRATALMGLKRYSEALRAYMRVLSMKPDSREAAAILRQALKNTPGSSIETPAFREAKNMLQAYSDGGTRRSSRLGQTTTWLLPGKAVRGGENTLPNLPMDRFVVLQALGIPVAEHILLVDGRILKDADEALVQIDPKTLVSVSTRKRSSRRNDSPMTLLHVPDYTFTPLPSLYADPQPDDSLTMYTINVYAEMGGTIRSGTVHLLTDKDGYATDPDPALAEGESAGICLTDKEQFAGVVLRSLDVLSDSPAQNVYVAHDFAPLLKRIQKTRSRSKRTITPKDAQGRTFTVYAVRGERFGEK
jgi:tetratricopeptide (TPR) repeat protein